MTRPLFALVESDELQRLCSADAIQKIGFDCLHFRTLHDLARALDQGATFHAIGIAAHPGPSGPPEGLRQTCQRLAQTAGARMLFMAHHTELEPLKAVLPQLLRAPGTGFICTPLQEDELGLRLGLLDGGRAT